MYTPNDSKERSVDSRDEATTDLSILIGGDAGHGVESGGAGLALAAARAGLHVFATSDARSRIRGGHNFYELRLAEREVHSSSDRVQLLVALTADSVTEHLGDLDPGAGVIFPDNLRVDQESLVAQGFVPMPMPLQQIADQHGSRMMINTGALAAAAAVIGLPLDYIAGVTRRNFARKGEDVVASNLRVGESAYQVATERYTNALHRTFSLPANAKPRLLMNGNQALAFGALAGGCRFMSAYPMTPATSIFEWLASLPPEDGVVTKHTEDEIAAVCMAIGASFVGARAMTATSGGGFCLMVEAIGLAGMTEVPIVIVNAQRGGPSTGLPTRTEQSDLLFAIHAGHGEFPKIVLAPASVEDCFETGWRALNLAERYQCPVIVMTDTFLASSLKTIDPGRVELDRVTIDRGASIDPGQIDPLDIYHRFQITDDGVSPRAFAGDPAAVFGVPSDEHDEFGHITEDADNRVRMMDKRMRKLEAASQEMRTPQILGPEDADLTLACWGSTVGPCLEAARLLKRSGQRVNVLKFTDLWPLPADRVRSALEGARRVIVVEQNYTGQLATLLRTTTGLAIDHRLNRYDGRPFSPEALATEAMKEMSEHVY
jgi:2-oxoglutarate ferredoxin oxidoreductase subunit alpha